MVAEIGLSRFLENPTKRTELKVQDVYFLF
jgi:hypothetical protein